MEGARHAATALGVGVALAAAPGPVQAVVLAESIRGGVARGLRALAGVHATFGALLVTLALGVSVVAPRGAALRSLQAAGGFLLLWLAADGARSRGPFEATGKRRLSPGVRGMLAIVLNPGGWLFLAAVASPLMATASEDGGPAVALLVAVALVVGAALGDLGLVFAGLGVRRASALVQRGVRLALTTVLAGLGVWLLACAALG